MLEVLLASSLVALQERPPLVFPLDIKMIRLDVSVVDGRGRPVAGLTASDFTVTEDGRPVEMALFEAVREGRSETGQASEGRLSTLEDQSPERRIVILVDTATMTTGQLMRARESTARYLREAAVEGDWVRLVNLATGEAFDGAVPEDRGRLAAAARSLLPGGSPWRGGGAVAEAIFERSEGRAGAASESVTSGQFLSLFAQASGLLGTLEALLVELDAVQGRKALVLVSPGFPQLSDLDRHLQKVATLARHAATAVYFVDVTGLDDLLPEPGGRMAPVFELAWSRSGGAQDLAEATGGFTSRFSNSLLPALARIGSEMRTYYVVGYVPKRPDDGRFRSVKVKVKGAGVRVRTKKGYLAGRPRR